MERYIVGAFDTIEGAKSHVNRIAVENQFKRSSDSIYAIDTRKLPRNTSWMVYESNNEIDNATIVLKR
jgi:hypothetical protein